MSQSSQLDQRPLPATGVPPVGEIYEEYAPFVWRNLRRLGISAANIEDAVQDVFLVIHRRLPEFESRSSLRTWIFGIVIRVASRQREQRRTREHRYPTVPEGMLEVLSPVSPQGPFDLLVQRQAADLVYGVLDEIDEEKRAIVVMVELEQMSVVEAAKVLDINLNTAYTRLRLARRALEARLKEILGDSGETP